MGLNPRVGYHFRILMPQGWMLQMQMDSDRQVYLSYQSQDITNGLEVMAAGSQVTSSVVVL